MLEGNVLGDTGTSIQTLLSCLAGFFLGFILPGVVAQLGVWQMKTRKQKPLPPRIDRASEALKELLKRERAATLSKLGQQSADESQEQCLHSDNSDSAESSEGDEEETSYSSGSSGFERMEELGLKMVLVIRCDGKRTPASEVATHAAGAAMNLAQTIQSDGACVQWKRWYLWWNMVGCAKIALKGPDVETLRRVLVSAQERGLPCCSRSRGDAPGVPVGNPPSAVRDIEEDLVVVAVGPVPSSEVNPITGNLKLFP
ncbi:peptidyl-tRNA hydrolase PTH2 [Trypanosoma brucei equiperdum]|uniref:peptidyl-tRNA hydrolase n=1 Tax=Trypanosoma brucei equiperdum TaxID=630700 RepID=A0A3L6L8L9_9TRYP|nr:peptidyl-tRNA hydrolase PTH2 [Trypanosoma brucei equiperdum]